MRVMVFERDDRALVVLPYDLYGHLPDTFGGLLVEIGTGELDLTCLSDDLVLNLGMKGYCQVGDDDAEEILRCIRRWKNPEPATVISE